MTQKALIYRSPKSAMQSGRANTHEWVLRFEPAEAKRIDPLMGWWGSGDTRGQLKLTFPTAEAAMAYAEAKGIPYEVERRVCSACRRVLEERPLRRANG